LTRRLGRIQSPAATARLAKARPSIEALESRLVLDRTTIDMAHVHLEAVYDGTNLSLQVNDTTNGVIYAPSDVFLYVNPNAEQAQPDGWSFIGAGDGNTFWQLPQEEDPTQLTIALSAEPIDPGTFDTYQPNDPRINRAGEYVKFSLRDVQGPGDVSLWQDGQAPAAWWWSTVDGGRLFDPAAYVESGGHSHFNWGFSATGIYNLTFELSAFANGHGLAIRSDDVTIRFGVETPDDGTPSPHRLADLTHLTGRFAPLPASQAGTQALTGNEPVPGATPPPTAPGFATVSIALRTVTPGAERAEPQAQHRFLASVSLPQHGSGLSQPLQEVLPGGLGGPGTLLGQ
jgi:surface-anchored protein